MSGTPDAHHRRVITDALARLGVEDLVLAIHDSCFPSRAEEDLGCGSPYSSGAAEFVRFIASLGFSGLQLGPQGQTSRINRSPYDGTLFSKNELAIAFGGLPAGWAALLPHGFWPELCRAHPPGGDPQADYATAYAASKHALSALYTQFAQRRETLPELAATLAAFRADHHDWLERDGLYAALTSAYGHDDWARWDSLDQRLFAPAPGTEAAAVARRAVLAQQHAQVIEQYALGQLLVHTQHQELHTLAASLGLRLYGDLQIGFSHVDRWSYQALFLPGYAMGAPPSRTNPEGQPWGYPVLDPRQYQLRDATGQLRPGPVLQFMARRLDKMLAEFDGVRLDHPHGLVCPWVYHVPAGDLYHSVQHGARLFSSPHLADHPALAELAITTAAQLNPRAGTPRYADDWVLALGAEQVARYGLIFGCLLDQAAARGRRRGDVLCEVLSTWPYPLRQVMAQHGLGRFCVTQKARLDDPNDVYRSENSTPADWIMIGNHDTPPLWRLLDLWHDTPQMTARARHLAERLEPDTERRPAMAERLAADPRALAQAMAAELFASPARHVMVFFADLLGLHEIYNRPGVVDPNNWSLRVPRDYAAHYRTRLRSGQAIDVPAALALALHARGADQGEGAALVAALGELSRAQRAA